MTPNASPNFAYLAHHDARLAALGTQAEEQFGTDPTVTLFKLRQFAEVLAKRAAAKVGLLPFPEETQQSLVERLFMKGVFGAQQRDLFHHMRRVGNQAVHDGKGDHAEALHQLRMARELGIWFQRTYGNHKKFDPGPFVPPADPQKAEAAVRTELDRLRKEVEERHDALEHARKEAEKLAKAAEEELRARLSAEEIAAKAKEDAATWEALASQTVESLQDEHAKKSRALEEENQRLLKELAALQAQAIAAPAVVAKTIERAAAASEAIILDEQATRRLIDEQLRKAGWEADTERLTFKAGVRPTRGRNLAIAEWPTHSEGKDGRADYVLFAGLQAIAIVEAKRQAKDVPGVLDQARRYSRGYLVQADETFPEGGPWRDHRIPFVFATNGRPYIRQLETKSGVWFHDVRRPDNLAVALTGWYTPEGLVDRLKLDIDAAHARLAVEPMPYIDRPFQREAILAVEKALANEQRAILLAMATGTGKTRTCIGLCYRLLKTRRFRRVLFLVDRNALGEQTASALKDLRLENLQTFTDIFDVRELADLKPERDTRLHIATVQAMVRRVLGPHTEASEADIPPVDQYDCIVVDECHRGYVLDRELSDREALFRDENDYISQYRRVLDHFDAVKIGLTATPALHTKEIFGAPVFTYSYREAVIDNFLVDHEPPTRIVTRLAKDGLHYSAQEEVLVLERHGDGVRKWNLPDQLDLDVEDFHRRVVVPEFNRAVLGELAKHIDPSLPEKTLIFCVNDAHADLVVQILKECLQEQYGSVDDDAVKKITGETTNPLEVIRRYRNEQNPNIGVTVDLLTTGIDVPRISNLVFLRRVRSRILYEQMLGRATRKCDEIHKERFRVFDAVDLYTAIQPLTDMKPVAVNPTVTFEALVREIVEATEETHRREAIDELLVKLHRRKRALDGAHQSAFEAAADMDLRELVDLLKTWPTKEISAWFADHRPLAHVLDQAQNPNPYPTIIDNQPDSVREVTVDYGKGKRPEDYLDAFRAYIQEHLNKQPALLVVTQRPRDLTRAELKKLLLALDQAGYSEAKLRTAWRGAKNEDIAATIIGYIRQLALGSPLVPYAERVDRAQRVILKRHKLSTPQVTWLRRITDALKAETIVDHASLDQGQFQAEGGFARLNKVFEGKLEAVLGELVDEVWSDAG